MGISYPVFFGSLQNQGAYPNEPLVVVHVAHLGSFFLQSPEGSSLVRMRDGPRCKSVFAHLGYVSCW